MDDASKEDLVFHLEMGEGMGEERAYTETKALFIERLLAGDQGMWERMKYENPSLSAVHGGVPLLEREKENLLGRYFARTSQIWKTMERKAKTKATLSARTANSRARGENEREEGEEGILDTRTAKRLAKETFERFSDYQVPFWEDPEAEATSEALWIEGTTRFERLDIDMPGCEHNAFLGLRTRLCGNQKNAIAWMRYCELVRPRCVPRFGVLALPMGEGKTLTCVALISRSYREICDPWNNALNQPLKEGHAFRTGRAGLEVRSTKSTLVVCKAETMEQWRRDASSHFNIPARDESSIYPSRLLRETVVYGKKGLVREPLQVQLEEEGTLERTGWVHPGNKKRRRKATGELVFEENGLEASVANLDRKAFVMITHELLASVHRSLVAGGNPTCLYTTNWRRVIVDEVSEKSSIITLPLSKITADFVWGISGTPDGHRACEEHVDSWMKLCRTLNPSERCFDYGILGRGTHLLHKMAKNEVSSGKGAAKAPSLKALVRQAFFFFGKREKDLTAMPHLSIPKAEVIVASLTDLQGLDENLKTLYHWFETLPKEHLGIKSNECAHHLLKRTRKSSEQLAIASWRWVKDVPWMSTKERLETYNRLIACDTTAEGLSPKIVACANYAFSMALEEESAFAAWGYGSEPPRGVIIFCSENDQAHRIEREISRMLVTSENALTMVRWSVQVPKTEDSVSFLQHTRTFVIIGRSRCSGVDLSRFDKCVIVDTLNLEHEIQALHRLHRPGQKRVARFVRIFMPFFDSEREKMRAFLSHPELLPSSPKFAVSVNHGANAFSYQPQEIETLPRHNNKKEQQQHQRRE